jgi:hypothetical protein
MRAFLTPVASSGQPAAVSARIATAVQAASFFALVGVAG